MATVSEIRANSTNILDTSIPIFEPLNAPVILSKRLERFGDHYNLTKDSHLYRFLSAICGDAGAGAVKKQLLYPRLQQQLEATHFTDLDRIYGNTLALPRLSEEIYTIDPKNEIMTQAQWLDVQQKDAAFRSRCLLWMRALIEGPTLSGIKLAAEAAIGVEANVYEQYKYLDNLSGDAPTTTLNIGQTSTRTEFIIVPQEPALTENEKRRVMKLVDRLRPVNSIVSVYNGDYIRMERPILDLASTSDRFNIQRFVSGQPNIDWPPLDPAKGFWIEAGVENETPNFAFMDRQEAITYLTIISSTASSEHQGLFNKTQQQLFSHLSDTTATDFYYSANRALPSSTTPLTLTMPWVTNSGDASLVFVSNSYPIDYFVDQGGVLAQNDQKFWASNEAGVLTTETLTFDLGRIRPVNFIDFEICQKPIDFSIEYFDSVAVQWRDIAPVEDTTFAVDYLPSTDNPWHHFECYFDTISTQQIRIIFTRRDKRFPIDTADYFNWSIEVRALRLMQLIARASDFSPDTGVDILGNTFRTDIQIYDSENIIDNDLTTFWQSQPNPSRTAVEALYFDLRAGYQLGTQQYLETWRVGELTGRSQADMEAYNEDGVIIDEVYVDPITFGPDMNIYYSTDDTADWDSKLWTPVPQRYILKKGFHALPTPTFVKYIKLEFTNLTAMPYQEIEHPSMPPVLYRQYPTWVQNYFNTILPLKPASPIVFEQVNIDPLTFGFQVLDDKFKTSFADIRSTQLQTHDDEISTVITSLTLPKATAEQESKINFYSPIMWQQDLINNLDSTRALSRIAQQPREINTTDTGWNSELGLPIYTAPTVQSVINLNTVREEKLAPAMFFPRTCRHGYLESLASRPGKIAYSVALREVGFYRRDYSIEFDETVYFETLDDNAHIELNQFELSDWRYIVQP